MLSDFDQAARYLIKLDPPGMLDWILPNRDRDLAFSRWLETQAISFPGEPERRCDTVMELASLSGSQPPWGIIVDCQTRQDASILERLLEYQARLYRLLRHGPHGADKYHFACALLNLTGPPQTGEINATVPGEGKVGLCWSVKVLTLERMSATQTLGDVAAGRLSHWVLPLVPLIDGATNAGILEEWERLANLEQDHKRKSDLGSLARIFAQLSPNVETWNQLLEEWNVEQSTLLREWLARGQIRTRQDDILRVLQRIVEPVPKDVAERIQAEEDLQRLSDWFDIALDCASIDDFRSRATQ